MTLDEIIEMARRAGFHEYSFKSQTEQFNRFAKLVRNDYSNKHAQLWLKRIDDAVKAEREACAKICDAFQERDVGMQPAECAGAIRARGGWNDEAIHKANTPQPKQEQGEPVAWADYGVLNWIADKQFKHAALLHTTPQPRTWVGLTDEQIDGLHNEIKVRLMGTFNTKDIYRVIEAKLKEKNT